MPMTDDLGADWVSDMRRSARLKQLRFLVPVWLTVALAVVAVAQSLAAAIPFDVMTFNIRTSNGQDGADSWPYRKALVVDTIRRFSPDVVGVQEALADQVAYLEAELPDYRWLGIDRGLNGGQGLSEFTPIFYRYQELSPVESGNFWLNSNPDTPPEITDWRGRRRRVGRIVTWARFHHLPTGRQVYVFNTHLTLRQGERQLESMTLIADRVAALPDDSIVIVAGDFNAPAEQSETWRRATERGLQDAWLLADERHGPEFTRSDFGPPRDWDLGRIDWILVGGPVQVLSAETVLHNHQGRYPSDHYPVTARLEIGSPR